MSHFTNPAFCQKSEFYPRTVSIPHSDKSHPRTVSQNVWTSHIQLKHQIQQKELADKIQQRKLPPKPGPKPICHLSESTSNGSNSKEYALVPLDEIPNAKRDNYAILPLDGYRMQNISMRLTKSQDNLDCISSESVYEEEDSFTSLPAFTLHDNKPKLISAFSTDFINKSMILVDQNSMQRYAIVPTDDDEDVVDSNHEIIEMHNGRAHRYAVIPTDDDQTSNADMFETAKRSFKKNPPIPSSIRPTKHFQSKLQATINPKPFSMTGNYISSQFKIPSNTQTQLATHCEEPIMDIHGAPIKNPIATQKLHELLSTPRKSKEERLQRHGSYQTIIQKSPNQFQLQEVYSPQKSTKFSPQKLQFEDIKTSSQNVEQRTTAIISPRLHQQSVYNETTDKTVSHESFQKIENATATIGIISFMLVLTGILNSGLCLYMVTDMRRSYYLDLGIISGFAATALGIMGFRSRQCYWLPNRNYISGYVLVTIFSLLNCCGLVVLLGLDPYPGTPFHDLTTGVILALSTLILLIISLGVITSKWCIAPPPDNRVHAY